VREPFGKIGIYNSLMKLSTIPPQEPSIQKEILGQLLQSTLLSSTLMEPQRETLEKQTMVEYSGIMQEFLI